MTTPILDLMFHRATAAFFAGFIEVRYNLVGRKYVGSVIIEKTSSRFFEPVPGRTGLVGASGTHTFSESRPNRCRVLRRIDTTALRFRFTGSLGRGCLHSWLSGGLSVSSNVARRLAHSPPIYTSPRGYCLRCSSSPGSSGACGTSHRPIPWAWLLGNCARQSPVISCCTSV